QPAPQRLGTACGQCLRRRAGSLCNRAAPRPGRHLITAAMRQAYQQLHALGHAHSVEVYDGQRLVGGIYGVAVGRMFFGESMFSAQSGGSKAALAGLAVWLHGQGWPLIDAQVENDHLLRMGAGRWPRERFLEGVHALAARPGRVGSWRAASGSLRAEALARPVLPQT